MHNLCDSRQMWRFGVRTSSKSDTDNRSNLLNLNSDTVLDGALNNAFIWGQVSRQSWPAHNLSRQVAASPGPLYISVSPALACQAWTLARRIGTCHLLSTSCRAATLLPTHCDNAPRWWFETSLVCALKGDFTNIISYFAFRCSLTILLNRSVWCRWLFPLLPRSAISP